MLKKNNTKKTNTETSVHPVKAWKIRVFSVCVPPGCSRYPEEHGEERRRAVKSIFTPQWEWVTGLGYRMLRNCQVCMPTWRHAVSCQLTVTCKHLMRDKKRHKIYFEKSSVQDLVFLVFCTAKWSMSLNEESRTKQRKQSIKAQRDGLL